MNHGLVQGDCLSVPLCNVYYGHLVRRHLQEFTEAVKDNQITGTDKDINVFARGMDDFIFASTSKCKAMHFLTRMKQGFPDYNCEIQKCKTMTNFSEGEGPNSKDNQVVFCGARIDPNNLSCRPDFSAYVNRNIAYASSFGQQAFIDPRGFILKKMLFLVGLKLQALYLDENLNGRNRVVANIFEIHYTSALRFHSLADSLIFIDGQKISVDYIQTLTTKCCNKVARVYAKVCEQHNLSVQTVTALEMKYLFLLAFKFVISNKSGHYGSDVVKYFKQKLSLHKLKTINELFETACSALKDSCLLNIKSNAYQKI